MIKFKNLFILSLLLISLSLILAQETNILPSTEITPIIEQNMDKTLDEELQETTYTFASENSAIQINKNNYWNVFPASEKNKAYVKIDNKNNLIEADITSSQETTWTFENKNFKIPAGTRVIYKEGKIEIFGKENQEIILTEKSSLENLKNIIKIGKESIAIEGNKILGKNFELNGIKIKEGALSIVAGGYLLNPNSIAEWKGLTLNANQDLFLATSKEETKNHANWIFPEAKKLSGKGSGFKITFNSGNTYAKIDPKDIFALDTLEIKNKLEFNLENRNSIGKIPLMNTKGDFIITQDSKTLKNVDGKTLIKKNAELNYLSEKYSTTSPIELLVEGQEQKYLISNFNGIATLPLDAETGKTDEQYANSLYWKRASTENKYNYPTIADFEKISGWKIILDENLKTNPLYIPEITRQLIDSYNVLPEKSKIELQAIYLYPEKKFEEMLGKNTLAYYHPPEQYLYLKMSPETVMTIESQFNKEYENQGTGFEQFRQEVAEATQDLMDGMEFSAKKGPEYEWRIHKLNYYDSLVKKIYLQPSTAPQKLLDEALELQKEIQEFSQYKIKMASNSDLYIKWDKIMDEGDKSYYYQREYGATKKLTQEQRYKKGFFNLYAPNNLNMHISSTTAKIVSDPAFFKRNGLLNKEKYPRFIKQIELLKEQGFITEQEYDAVYFPEKYGLK